MKTIKVKVFEFKELNKEAQQKAIEWYKEIGFEYDWFDFTKEDFQGFLESVGFENVKSWFSGFYSQGDGACFEFKGLDFKLFLNYKENETKPYSETFLNWKKSNKELLRNVSRFYDVLSCNSISHGSHYSHQKTKSANVDFGPYSQRSFEYAEKFTNQFEESLTGLMEDLATDYYKALENDWDGINSDESISETIEANEYTFTKNGKRFG